MAKAKIQNFLHPIDRVAIASILTLSITIALMTWGGRACTGDCWLHAGPRVRNFSWQNQKVSAEDTAFLLTFSRPMDRESVETNLVLEPPLSGKTSWVGRTMAYTLDAPAPYGVDYQLSVKGAKERFTDEDQGTPILPFEAEFSTRDRAFAYIGVEGDEEGRLILFNFTTEEKTPLTPPNLIVTDFKPYRDRTGILVSAIDRRSKELDPLEQQLYIAPTGLDSSDQSTVGSVQRVVDNQDYQNLAFDLSRDGESIVVQRIHRKNPADVGLWIERDDRPIERLSDTPGGEFAIAPDSKTLVSGKGEGIALLSLDPDQEPLDFLPKFGRILSFNGDGSAAAMVNFNKNNPDLRYVQSLYLVDNQGTQRKVADVRGSIVNCEFNPAGTTLYCLLTELIEGEQYSEQPYFAAIDLEEQQGAPILKLPDYRDIHMSLAPDGLGILFDRVVVDPQLEPTAILRTNSGEAIATSNLWLLITPSSLPDKNAPPALEKLPIPGMRPQWLP
ncbi:MAG: hypothetical protein SW833_21020 [Cyanobacteriota bacterium]|nr:hypothetical protein [Cyanobacteriota bacterium]